MSALRTIDLDTRIAILRPASVDDGFSHADGALTIMATMWAKRSNLRTSSKLAAAIEGTAVPALFSVRRTTEARAIRPGDAVQAPDGKYRVVAVRDDPSFGHGVALEISCMELQ